MNSFDLTTPGSFVIGANYWASHRRHRHVARLAAGSGRG